MGKVNVVYYSMSGNTEAMADAVVAGAIAAGAEAEKIYVGDANIEDLKNANAFALGCPAMGSEQLEEAEMEPFVCEVETFAAGKNIALFGSYAWAVGEWMDTWTDRMVAAGANVLNGHGTIAYDAPDDAAIAACEDLGKQLAALV